MNSKNFHAKQRSAVLAAFKADLAARRRLLALLRSFDPEIIACAVECFGSAAAADDWLTSPAHALSGKIPVELKGGSKQRETVLRLLRMIQYGTL